ncbi:MAG: hypothetical protein WDO18_23050 [Acidobacteriota bacterium]
MGFLLFLLALSFFKTSGGVAKSLTPIASPASDGTSNIFGVRVE